LPIWVMAIIPVVSSIRLMLTSLPIAQPKASVAGR
jgi:hypothetical protein